MDFFSEQIMSNNSVPRCASGHCVVSEAIILSMAAYSKFSSFSMLNESSRNLIAVMNVLSLMRCPKIGTTSTKAPALLPPQLLSLAAICLSASLGPL
jgi:uncharacterized membrane protein